MENIDINSYIIKINQLLGEHKYADAKPLLENICKHNKKNVGAWLTLANVNRSLGEIESARLNCNDIIKNQPGNVIAHSMLGAIYEEQGEINLAEKEYKKVIDLYPNGHAAYNSIGTLWHKHKDYMKAENYYINSIKIEPKQPTIMFNLAAVLQEQGEIKKSIKCYQKAIDLSPEYAKAFSNLAYLYRQIGELEKSVKNYKLAIKYAPDIAEIYVNLGISLEAMNEYNTAEENYNLAIKTDPSYVKSYLSLGMLMVRVNKYDDAIKCFNIGLKTNPDDTDLLYQVGCTLMLQNKSKEAFGCLTKACFLNPNDINTLNALAVVCLKNDHIGKAKQYATLSINIEPSNIESNLTLAKVYERMGDYDNALKCCHAVLEYNLDDMSIISVITNIYEKRGEFELALDMIEPHIDDAHLHHAILIEYSKLARHFKFQKKAIVLLESYINQNRSNHVENIDIYIELGKHYDAAGNYENSFKYYSLFNMAQKDSSSELINNYDPTIHNRTINHWINNLDRNFWKNVPISSSTSKRPIFVLGMPRSGTSLVEQILSSHPHIFGAGELNYIPGIISSISSSLTNSEIYPDCMVNLSSKIMSQHADSYLEQISVMGNTSTNIVDKMPTNFWHIGLISKLFPNAKIIHIKRNPVDTCLSMFFQKFGESMPFTTDLEWIGMYYNDYEKLMSYWDSVLDIKIYNIQYEELVSNIECISREMIEFCDLGWNKQCLEFYKTKRDVCTPSYDQVRQPIYNKSVNRWEHYKDFIKPLTEMLNYNE